MPRVELAQVISRLAAGKRVSGVLLLGDDAYLRQQCRAQLVEAVLPGGAGTWGVSRFSLAETESAEAGLGRILGQAQTLPMLAPRQVVFVQDLEALDKLDERSRDAAVDRLAAYLGDPAPFTLLVFEAAQLDQRMRLFKSLSEKLSVVALALPEEPEERLRAAAGHAIRMAGELGVTLEPAAAGQLADLLSGALAFMQRELEKLAAYVGDRRRITPKDVELLVVTEKKYSVWQLAELLASRQRDAALRFLNGVLQEGEQPVGIVGALAWMYRRLIQAQELPPYLSIWDAVRQLGIRKEAAEVALRNARRIPRQQLLAGLGALYEADNRLKSGTADPGAIMEFLVAQLTAPGI
jgi:DNA polymerase-3 subunit delta